MCISLAYCHDERSVLKYFSPSLSVITFCCFWDTSWNIVWLSYYTSRKIAFSHKPVTRKRSKSIYYNLLWKKYCKVRNTEFGIQRHLGLFCFFSHVLLRFDIWNDMYGGTSRIPFFVTVRHTQIYKTGDKGTGQDQK